MAEILIVDDDVQLRQSFARLLGEEGYDVRMASSGEAGIQAVEDHLPDLVVMDVRMPGIDGIETLQRIQAIDAKLPVVIMTAFGTTETAIEATKQGAFDYVLKPFDVGDMLKIIEQAVSAGRMMHQQVQMGAGPETGGADAIIGQSPSMQKVYKAIGRVAPTDATVLIRGESGTGKELVARAIYQHSQRAGKPFLVINCVAIPETLLESELFGYERGAFTGAASRRVGKFEQAHGGTVFLDEIGDMPMSIQAKILRLLQERSVERLGGQRPIDVDVRIIAATNRDLERALEDERFREDLYYRLKVVTIKMPPLKERKEDIPLLIDYFLSRFSREMQINNPGISDEARQGVEQHFWPGNVRELGNTIKKALIFSRGYPIQAGNIYQAIAGESRDDNDGGGTDLETAGRNWIRAMLASEENPDMFNFLMDQFGRMVVGEALNLTGGNRSRAARLLGMSRPTLQARIEKYNLSLETSVKSS
ncbi:nitrogen regulation protein NR(I) [Desulfosalsimonas propionicica]|uniref:DNA-binding transcriptional regulator NtrC n=1 Tax=Desulfosalsimonas propionicica TaxID=332175 RepID=A0A7W0C6Y6_9BACT|nr:sigma-54 dependent transcriptional regulator [Desulfosalsimonas propionicica]MBA2880318.1 nitrogen regulation protein NR(I) [Desulfosalsimonas propionicica]